MALGVSLRILRGAKCCVVCDHAQSGLHHRGDSTMAGPLTFGRVCSIVAMHSSGPVYPGGASVAIGGFAVAE